MIKLLPMLGLCTALTAPALAQNPRNPPVTDRERDAFGAAVARSDADALRAIVGPSVLLSRGMAFDRSSPEALIEATRGCRLFEAARIGDSPDMWYRFACPGRPRGAIRDWEDPGIYIKLWHHPAGVLAAYFYPGPVEVRRPPPGWLAAPPPPPLPPRPRPRP